MADDPAVNPYSVNRFESTGGDILGSAKYVVWQTAYVTLAEGKNHPTFSVDEVFPVWYSKSLQNWKGTFTTSLPDGRYYEVTYNGDRQELYVDVYKKTHHFDIAWAKENNE